MTPLTQLQRSGRGPKVVLVHGVGLDHHMWDDARPLLEAQYEVITYDLLGHGGTADSDGERTLGDFVDQLVSVITRLGDDPVDLVGCSLGSLISLQTAAQHPELVDRLVLANMVFGRSKDERDAVNRRLQVAEQRGMPEVADLAIDRWFTTTWQQNHPERIARIRDRLSTTDLASYVKAYRVFVSSDIRQAGTASQAERPTLALTGALDPGSTPAMSHELARVLPNGRAQILPGLHHLPAVEDPQTFVESLLSFFASESTYA